MLDNLTQRMTRVMKTLRGEARLTEANTQEILREVRLALLEADVALPVVREFIAKVQEKALGAKVISSLTPGQALVDIVQKELTLVIGGGRNSRAAELNLAVTPPAVILMVGLQGAGKTTTVGKLAKLLREKQKKKVLTVSCDVYRPAAIAQLKSVTEQTGADFFSSQPNQNPLDISRAALDWAKRHYHDVLIVDTAGRFSIDDKMMKEIAGLHAQLRPAETLFVVDAMLGQDAVNIAKTFSDALPLTGIVLTKLDGDSRGGASLSVHYVTGRPIKFVGIGEKLDGLEIFYPERMANRILGMGDILALVEEAQRSMDILTAEKLAEKVKKGGAFDLNDLRAQLSQMKKIGGLSALIDKLPAQFHQASSGANIPQAEKQIYRMEGIINSMTPSERAKPDLIKAKRKRRIATGAGVQVQEVNRMLNQFEHMRSIMKKIKGSSLQNIIHSIKSVLPGPR
ncbi:signal recognition particle protein [Candidatus Vallotia cooleyia]|uniref:signal recognition particle protein n=1 Tax=Candidatus Vallotiella adelgis TaxID=1177211 RepID=UPI001D01DD6F|nr:signal recognition particle protein [Candidatus Vallotia cooleyia]UDG82202.1 Signal recognition particle protein [Candidatus Vallotia cooleyia]